MQFHLNFNGTIKDIMAIARFSTVIGNTQINASDFDDLINKYYKQDAFQKHNNFTLTANFTG